MKGTRPRIGVIGYGMMGRTLASIWAADGYDVRATRRTRAWKPDDPAIAAAASNAMLVRESDVVVLCVKPHDVASVGAEIAPWLEPRHVVLSIAAGLTITELRRACTSRPRLARAMPAMTARSRASMTSYAVEDRATERIVLPLLRACGEVIRIDERHFDVATVLAASGPALVLAAAEGMCDAALREGLPLSLARRMVMHAFIGTARLVLDGMHPALVRESIATPGGCTIEALAVLEGAGVRAAYAQAVHAGRGRLSGGIESNHRAPPIVTFPDAGLSNGNEKIFSAT